MHAVWETMTGAFEAAMVSAMVCMFAWERSMSMRRAFIRLDELAAEGGEAALARRIPTPAWFFVVVGELAAAQAEAVEEIDAVQLPAELRGVLVQIEDGQLALAPGALDDRPPRGP